MSVHKLRPATSAAADNEHEVWVCTRGFVFCWNRRFFNESSVIHLVGGAGNVVGDGASKYLLLAKCIFGGDMHTPAGDANDIGDRGEIRPVEC